MVHATFLIKFQNTKYTSTSGYFDHMGDAHQKAHDIAQCKDHLTVTCWVDGVDSGFVARHGDKTVYGD